MNLIDGKKLSLEIKNELNKKIIELSEKLNKRPGLVTILVGENSASKVYVNSKIKTCAEIGINSKLEKLNEEISESDLLKVIKQYNEEPQYHGILVQLPLPEHIDEDTVIAAINPQKDVDGFHPVSVGNLVIGKDTFIPCTPFGIIEMLKRYNIETKGKHVVVVGRSNIVGKPIANLMLQKREAANSTVTVCHSATEDIASITRQADILIAAVGRPHFITADMVKENTVVIDVGINSIDAPELPKGYRIVGDVDFENVKEKASYITPVPGGVGRMTIAMLMYNTYKAFINIEKV